MALILMCGYPASGKSTVSDKLSKLLRDEGRHVVVVRDGHDVEELSRNDDGESSDVTAESRRSVLYRDSTMEKKTRAMLRAATERALNASSIVICDSLNYIKGFRYEMFCVAKTTGTRYCVVLCEQAADACVARDLKRSEEGEDAYGEDMCRALIRRFEEPADRNRWDSPLHRVDVSRDGWEELLAVIRDSALRTGNRLAPSMATRVRQKPGADVLGMLDRLTREAEATIVQDIQGGKGVGEKVLVSGASQDVRLARKPKIAELRNMRRSYLNLARMHPPQGKSREALIDEYVEYVNAQLAVKR